MWWNIFLGVLVLFILATLQNYWLLVLVGICVSIRWYAYKNWHQ